MKKVFSLILFVTIVLMTCTTAFAASVQHDSDDASLSSNNGESSMLQYPLSGSNDFIIDLPNVSTRSYNSSFTLDFGSSSAWYLNFDNNAFAFLNHRYVSVSYDSCSPNNSGGKVRIELYIDDDEDGVYELYDPNGGYTYQLVVGELIKIELPLGNTVAKYRLRFVNLTSSVTSGNFTVTTSRN